MNIDHANLILAHFRRRRTFDPKCATLAAAFLADHPNLDTQRNQDALAYEIQQAVDGWIAEALEAKS